MSTSTILRRTAAIAACLAVASPAFSQPEPGRTWGPGDGAPTAAACAPLGFDLSPGHHNAPGGAAPIVGISGRMASGAAPAYAASPPPPPPPPPSPPPPPPPSGVANRVEHASPPVIVPGPRPPLAQPVPGAPETYPQATPNPVRRTLDEPVSTFSVDVDTASYSNVRRFIDDSVAPPRDAVRVEEMINYFDYDYARPADAQQPFAVTTALTDSPWSEGRRIVHVGLQGYELPEAERRPLNLTFLVDVSGSMDRSDKLGLAKQAMNLIIDQMRPQDTVAVTYYAQGAGTTLAPTPGTDRLRIRCAVESLVAWGGTAGATGMTNAYDQAEANFAADRVNRILMFTDGDFNVGVTDNRSIEEYVAGKRRTGIYLSVYGFGRGNYQDARMQTIAQSGNGVAAYVDNLNEARRLFGDRFHQGAFPIADDVKIQVEFNPAHVAEWRLIGYETRLLNEEDFNNDAVDAGEVGSGASVTALYEITPVGGPTQIGERRYDTREAPAATSHELAFVQVRYKLPGEDESVLMQVPVNVSDAGPPLQSTRWAMAVAAFGQKLRGDPWLASGYGWNQVLDLAQGARGEDLYGERAAFVQMVRSAETLPERRTP